MKSGVSVAVGRGIWLLEEDEDEDEDSVEDDTAAAVVVVDVVEDFANVSASNGNCQVPSCWDIFVAEFGVWEVFEPAMMGINGAFGIVDCITRLRHRIAFRPSKSWFDGFWLSVSLSSVRNCWVKSTWAEWIEPKWLDEMRGEGDGCGNGDIRWKWMSKWDYYFNGLNVSDWSCNWMDWTWRGWDGPMKSNWHSEISKMRRDEEKCDDSVWMIDWQCVRCGVWRVCCLWAVLINLIKIRSNPTKFGWSGCPLRKSIEWEWGDWPTN